MSHSKSRVRSFSVLCGILAVLVGLVILLQHSSGTLAAWTARIENSKLEPADGGAYAWSIPAKLRQTEIPTSVRLLENGAPLTQAATSNQVREGGRGLFSISLKQVWLSSTDGTDPRQNGRRYEVQVSRNVPKLMLTTAWILIFLGALFLTRGLWGFWIWSALWPGTAQAAAPRPKPAREWSLDAIRGIAIMLVLFAHVPWPKGVPDFPKPLLLMFNRGGWMGVDLFFVLSGYLISGLLLEEWRQNGSVRVGRFLYRRAWKIYPAHWILILATVVAATFVPLQSAEVSIDRITHELLYLQNYLGGVWGHTWSLGVEEQFYLLLAFAFALAVSQRAPSKDGENLRWLPRLALCICLICPALRILRFLHGGHYAYNYAATHLHGDALMWGVLLRYARHARPDVFVRWADRLRWWGPPAIAVLLSPCFAYGRNDWTMTIGLTAVSLATCLLILTLYGWQQRHGSGPVLAPLCFLGRHSYTLYLWHFPLVQVMSPYYLAAPTAPTSMAWFAGYVVATMGISLSVSWLIEAPLLRLRDRLVPSGIGNPATSRG